MKKFFSLVLALVMALSLTTVAWGAYSGSGTGIEADPYQVSTEIELTEAVALGGYIKLMTSFSVANKVSIVGDTVIDGNYCTLTYTGTDRAITVEAGVDADLTINNLTVAFTGSYRERGINYNTNGKLTLNNVTIGSEAQHPTYAVSLPGSSDNAVVNINDCVLFGKNTLNIWGEDMVITVTDSDITSVDTNSAEDYVAIALNSDGTVKAEGTQVSVVGGSVTAKNQSNNPSNAVSNATDTATVTFSGASVVGNEFVPVAIINYSNGTSYMCGSVAEANATAKAGETIVLLPAVLDSGETFEMLDDVDYELPAGADMVTLPNGDVAVVTPATFSGTTAITSSFKEDGTYYVLYNGIWDEVTYVPADDNGDGTGNVAYFEGDLANYIICKKNDDDAMKLTSGFLAGDKLLNYVKVSVVEYTATATAVNASLYATCTTDINAKGYKVVDAYGAVTYYKDPATGVTPTNWLLVGKEIKGVVPQVEVTDYVMGGHALIQNRAAWLDEAETIHEYKCVICGTKFNGTTTKAAGVTYVPYFEPNLATKTAYTTAGYDMSDVDTGNLWLISTKVPSGGAASTDKTVTSADTFDAGIAMYVGMSVMAAAGSAVVIGKKKD